MDAVAWKVYAGPMVVGDPPCPVCGRPIPRRGFVWQGDGDPSPAAPRVGEDGAIGWRWVGHSGRGRPRLVCGKSCHELRAAVATVGRLLDSYPGQNEPAARLRSEIWAQANRLNRRGGIRKKK